MEMNYYIVPSNGLGVNSSACTKQDKCKCESRQMRHGTESTAGCALHLQSTDNVSAA